ncbi:MAG: flavodoxin family protein [Paracoccaceae bacterium]
MRIAIAFHSGSGHTRRLTEIVAAELTALGAAVDCVDVEQMAEPDWQALAAAEAIVFAAPTYMGSVSAPFKAFMDESSEIWSDGLWADKIAAGMTVATFPSGDKLSTLIQMVVFAAQHGMIWLGQSEIGAPAAPGNDGIDEDGFSLGLAATSVRDKTRMIRPGDELTAKRFAARLHATVRRWAG